MKTLQENEAIEMIKLHENGAYLKDGLTLVAPEALPADQKASAADATMAWGILSAQNRRPAAEI